MVQTFHRAQAARKFSGYGLSEFYEAIKDGRFPKPDAYLGPRSPVWTDETLANWQREQIKTSKTSAREAA
ncbi:AlpA family phage regulatory protein [Bradyrhizobium sp. OAE829]|uniref:helix-turn-helix transcriptional regulator n=1 Tax=Bradyrhizobium sp. OAE829 TaxID=2663807 RepID=UPI00178A95B3